MLSVHDNPDAARILVVEDDADDAAFIKSALAELSIEAVVEHVWTGAEAVRRLEADDRLPDLILLDLVMPEMDGPTFLEWLRMRPRYDGTAVVVLTSRPELVEGLHPPDLVITKRFSDTEKADLSQAIIDVWFHGRPLPADDVGAPGRTRQL